jgi:hypothetical protein
MIRSRVKINLTIGCGELEKIKHLGRFEGVHQMNVRTFEFYRELGLQCICEC